MAPKCQGHAVAVWNTFTIGVRRRTRPRYSRNPGLRNFDDGPRWRARARSDLRILSLEQCALQSATPGSESRAGRESEAVVAPRRPGVWINHNEVDWQVEIGGKVICRLSLLANPTTSSAVRGEASVELRLQDVLPRHVTDYIAEARMPT